MDEITLRNRIIDKAKELGTDNAGVYEAAEAILLPPEYVAFSRREACSCRTCEFSCSFTGTLERSDNCHL